MSGEEQKQLTGPEKVKARDEKAGRETLMKGKKRGKRKRSCVKPESECWFALERGRRRAGGSDRGGSLETSQLDR